MSRKKHDLLTRGLTSELFLVAFIEPDNVRKLGQRLQNTTKTPTNYSKVHPAIHDLTIAKYLKFRENDGKYYPVIEQLIEDINDFLKTKNIFPNEDEIELLKILLKRDDFLKALSYRILKDLQSQPKGTHEINSLNVLCSFLGMICASLKFLKNHHPDFKNSAKSKRSLKNIIDDYQDKDQIIKKVIWLIEPEIENMFYDFKEKNKKSSLNILMKFINSMPSITILSEAPNKTLEKFSKLWDQYIGFTMGAELALDIKKI